MLRCSGEVGLREVELGAFVIGSEVSSRYLVFNNKVSQLCDLRFLEKGSPKSILSVYCSPPNWKVSSIVWDNRISGSQIKASVGE